MLVTFEFSGVVGNTTLSTSGISWVIDQRGHVLVLDEMVLSIGAPESMLDLDTGELHENLIRYRTFSAITDVHFSNAEFGAKP